MTVDKTVSILANKGQGVYGVPSQEVVPTPWSVAQNGGFRNFVLAESSSVGFGVGDDACLFNAASANGLPQLVPGSTIACNFDPRAAAPVGGAVLIQHCNVAFSRGFALAIGGAAADTNRRRMCLFLSGINAGQYIDLPGSSVFPHIGLGFAFALTVTDDGSELRYMHTGALGVTSVPITGTINPPAASDPIAVGRGILASGHATNIALGGIALSSVQSTDDELIAIVSGGLDVPVPTLRNENFRIEAGQFSYGNNYAHIVDGLGGDNLFNMQGALRPQRF